MPSPFPQYLESQSVANMVAKATTTILVFTPKAVKRQRSKRLVLGKYVEKPFVGTFL